MKRISKTMIAMCLVLASALALPAIAGAALDAEDVNEMVMVAVEEFKADNDNADKILGAAKGFLVCPSITKLGLGIGIERGTCAMRIDGETTEFYKTTSAKWGLLAGIEAHSLVMAFNDEKELKKFRTGKRGFKVGADVTVAVAQRGASGEIDLDKLLKTPIAAYVFGESGLMYDVSIEGTTFKQVDAEYDLGRLFDVVATANLGQSSNAISVQMRIGIDRFVTEAERAHMVKVLRGEAEPMEMEPCGVIQKGNGEPSDITYAYARKVDDFNYKVILGTRESIPFLDSWRPQVDGEGDLTVIQLNVNTNHVGTGVLLLGGEVSWSESENRVVLDSGRTRPIQLGSVSAEGF